MYVFIYSLDTRASRLLSDDLTGKTPFTPVIAASLISTEDEYREHC